jgi:hypothetical protein
MAVEQFANAAPTALNGSINNSVTSIVVASSSGFPSTGNFRIIIDSEIMLVTAVSGTTWTVTRGYEGTSAASHVDVSQVTHILTAGSQKQLRADAMQVGSVASLPTVGVSGREYITSDDLYTFQDNGVSWTALGPTLVVSPPTFTGYAWTNQGSASMTLNTNGSAIQVLPSGSSNNLRAYMKTVPSAPYTFTIGIIPQIFGGTSQNRAGMCLYDGTKFVVYAIYGGGSVQSPGLVVEKWDNTTTFNANYTLLNGNTQSQLPGCGSVLFLRIYDDGTTRHFQASMDNQYYVELANHGNTDFLTPTKIGLVLQGNNGTSGVTVAQRIIHLG